VRLSATPLPRVPSDGQTSGLQPDEACSIHVARSDAANRIETRLECHSSIEGAFTLWPLCDAGTKRWARIVNPRGRVQLASASPLLALVRADPGVGLLSPMSRFDSGRAHTLSLSWGIHAPGSDPGRLGSTPSREAPRAPAGSGLRFAIPTALGSTPRLEADALADLRALMRLWRRTRPQGFDPC
jgi:hypothetical protein